MAPGRGRNETMNHFEDITDLPERYRKQAAQKLHTQAITKSKYRNQPTEVKGIKFDSKKEAERYTVLMDKLKNSEISDLRLQVSFTLVEGFTAPTGDRIRPIRYIADFTYYDSEGAYIVEDVKSPATRKDKAHRLKNRLMADRYGIIIREI